MAAALAAPVAGKAVDLAVESYRDFSKDPMKWVADHAVKWGFMTALAGGLSYIVSVASARQEQAFLNDIQARLGQPTTVSPTPPKAPPPAPTPTLAQTTMTIVAGSVYNIDLTNSKVTGQKCLDAVNALQMLLDQLLAQGGSPDAIAGCVLGIQDFGLAAQQLGWWPPGTSVTVAPTNPDDPPTTLTYQVWTYESAKTVYWSQAEDWVWVASNATNQVAQALNLPVPFNVPTAAPGAPPPPRPATATTFGWLSGFTAFIVQGVVSLGADAQQAVNDVTGAIGTVANDVQAFAGDVGKAVAYASRMILNLPIIGCDAIGYGVCWFGHTVFGDMAPWLLGLGVGLMVAGALAGMLYPRIVPRIELVLNARGATFWNRVDKRLGIRRGIQSIWTQKSTEAAMHSANAEPMFVTPDVELATPAPSLPIVGQPSDSPEPLGPKIEPPSAEREGPPSQTPPGVPPAPSPVNSPPPPSPGSRSGPAPRLPEAPVPATEAEKEALLGEQPSLRERKMAIAADKPQKPKEWSADELLELANSFPTQKQQEALVAEAERVGRMEGRGTYRSGAEKREVALDKKIAKMETVDGPEGVQAAEDARVARERARHDGERSIQEGQYNRKSGYQSRRKRQPGDEDY